MKTSTSCVFMSYTQSMARLQHVACRKCLIGHRLCLSLACEYNILHTINCFKCVCDDRKINMKTSPHWDSEASGTDVEGEKRRDSVCVCVGFGQAQYVWYLSAVRRTFYRSPKQETLVLKGLILTQVKYAEWMNEFVTVALERFYLNKLCSDSLMSGE